MSGSDGNKARTLKRERIVAQILRLVPMDDRSKAFDLIQDLDVAAAENVYCTWFGNPTPLGEVASMEELRARMREHAKACPKHPAADVQRQLNLAVLVVSVLCTMSSLRGVRFAPDVQEWALDKTSKSVAAGEVSIDTKVSELIRRLIAEVGG